MNSGVYVHLGCRHKRLGGTLESSGPEEAIEKRGGGVQRNLSTQARGGMTGGG